MASPPSTSLVAAPFTPVPCRPLPSPPRYAHTMWIMSLVTSLAFIRIFPRKACLTAFDQEASLNCCARQRPWTGIPAPPSPPQSLCRRMCLPRSRSRVQREPGRLGPGNGPSQVAPGILGAQSSFSAPWGAGGDGYNPGGQTEVTKRRDQEPQKGGTSQQKTPRAKGKPGSTGSGVGRKGCTLN